MEENNKIDKIREVLTEIRITQVEQQKDLEKHIARSEANERRLDYIEMIYGELKEHLNKVEGGIIAAKWVGAAITVIWTVLKVLTYMKG